MRHNMRNVTSGNIDEAANPQSYAMYEQKTHDAGISKHTLLTQSSFERPTLEKAT
jgi:hypothetical protein